MENPAKSDYRRWIDEVLGREPLEVMSTVGFKKRGITYSRIVGGVKQVVRFGLVVRPRYAKDSAQLVLNVDTSVPEADSIYAEATRGIPNVLVPYFVRDAGESIIRGSRRMWLFSDEAEAANLEGPIAGFLAHDIIPYLAARSTVADLADQLKSEVYFGIRSSGSIRTERAIYVAALLRVAGREADVRQLLDAAYPSGSRDREDYDSAIEFLYP